VFTPINCGAVTESLFESEFFGHRKGAFTGAHKDKRGLFDYAHRGTLFLDEVGELRLSMQVKLLRALPGGGHTPVGDHAVRKTDVRIITATNIDLASTAKQGKFREDLFHRLNEFHIVLPPLRERKEDILVLSKYFLDEANREFSKDIKGFSPETAQFILEYPWTGNVRELRNEIRKASLLTESEYVVPIHLSPHIVEPHHEMQLTKLLDKQTPFEDIIKKVEKVLIERALEQADGNKVKAAKILQINRKRLYRKMERLGM